MGLQDVLVKKYGYDVPFLLEDLLEIDNSKSKATVRRQVNRLVESSKLDRYAYREGVFYVPDPNPLFKKKTVSTDKVIERLYLFKDCKRIGYETGFKFANRLSLTTQNPFLKEIVTNNTNSRKRQIKLNTREIIIRKTRVNISDENYREIGRASSMETV